VSGIGIRILANDHDPNPVHGHGKCPKNVIPLRKPRATHFLLLMKKSIDCTKVLSLGGKDDLP
jgi:hypothetical protein